VSGYVRSPNRARALFSLIVTALLIGLFTITPAAPAAAGSAGPGKFPPHRPVPAAPGRAPAAAAAVPTDAFCRANYGVPCYSPQEMRTAYGLAPIIKAGFTGRGESIVIIDSFGSPTLQQDLHTFDAGYGLPDPPSLKVLAPLGSVPFDPTNGDMVNWAFETTLDVEWAHALAPAANIVLLTSPVDETEGVQGMPEFLTLERYALDHHLGKIISQSWSATENTLFTPAGKQVLNDFENFYARARDERVTVLASSGDTGSTNYELDLMNLYPYRVVGFPASSPLVTAVGGTSLFADTNGNYQSETVWDEAAVGASGGGVSQYFAEPDYERAALPRPVKQTLAGKRGMPDLAYNGDPYTSILVYMSFIPGGEGYYFIGGTSEGSPQWAGIIADLNQMAGRPLGFINPALYRLGKSGGLYAGFHDVTVGNNGFGGVPGYPATRGWDLSTGWGTPNIAGFARSLIDEAK
jgi:subtilase family serine protease